MRTETTTTSAQVINGHTWVEGRKEMIRSLFSPGGTPVGYYTFSPKTSKVVFYAPNGDPIACLVKRKHNQMIFTSMTTANGRAYYMYAMSSNHERLFGVEKMGLVDTDIFARSLYTTLTASHSA